MATILPDDGSIPDESALRTKYPWLNPDECGELGEPILMAGEAEPPPYVGPWNNRVAKDSVTLIFGAGGMGKSFLALGIAMAHTIGCDFLGQPMNASGKALYLDYEMGKDEQIRRVYRMARGLGLQQPPTGLYYLKAAAYLKKSLARLADLIVSHDFKLIVIDSFGPGSGVKPEDAESVTALLQPLSNMCDALKVAVILIDHQSKMQKDELESNKTAFGSGYKSFLSRSILHLTSKGDGNDRLMKLRQTKLSFSTNMPDMYIRPKFTREMIEFQLTDDYAATPSEAEPYSMADQIMDMGGWPMTARAVAERLGTPDKIQQARNALASLAASGRLVRGPDQGNAKSYAPEGWKPPDSLLVDSVDNPNGAI